MGCRANLSTILILGHFPSHFHSQLFFLFPFRFCEQTSSSSKIQLVSHSLFFSTFIITALNFLGFVPASPTSPTHFLLPTGLWLKHNDQCHFPHIFSVPLSLSSPKWNSIRIPWGCHHSSASTDRTSLPDPHLPGEPSQDKNQALKGIHPMAVLVTSQHRQQPDFSH